MSRRVLGRSSRWGRRRPLRARRAGAREPMHPAGHTRCPRYVRGALGVIEGVRGADGLPDRAVYGEDAPRARLFGGVPLPGALGGGDEAPLTVPLDLWDSYLDPADDSTNTIIIIHDPESRSSCARGRSRRCWSSGASCRRRHRRRRRALRARRRTAQRRQGGRAGVGGPGYRERLLAAANGDRRARVRWRRGRQHGRGGEHAGRPQRGRVHAVLLLPVAGAGPAADLVQEPAYRARVVSEPRAVLREFGLDLPDEVEIRVWDSSAEVRYLVLPKRPAGTDGWSEGARGARHPRLHDRHGRAEAGTRVSHARAALARSTSARGRARCRAITGSSFSRSLGRGGRSAWALSLSSARARLAGVPAVPGRAIAARPP